MTFTARLFFRHCLRSLDHQSANALLAMLRIGGICCAPKSALENRISSAKGLLLKGLGEKLRGRAYLDDGSPITVADKYWPAASVRPEDILNSLRAQHPFLMDWSGYVLYGARFDEYKYQDGARSYLIHSGGIMIPIRAVAVTDPRGEINPSSRI
jgi:hypothetical protein